MFNEQKKKNVPDNVKMSVPWLYSQNYFEKNILYLFSEISNCEIKRSISLLYLSLKGTFI